MEADIRKLAKRQAGEDSDDEPAHKKAKSKSALEEELARYAKSKGVHSKKPNARRKDESDILAAMNSFRTRLQQSLPDKPAEPADEDKGEEEGEMAGEEPPMEVDRDAGFLSHQLNFPKDNAEEVQKAERDYEVSPRFPHPRARHSRRRVFLAGDRSTGPRRAGEGRGARAQGTLSTEGRAWGSTVPPLSDDPVSHAPQVRCHVLRGCLHSSEPNAMFGTPCRSHRH